MSTPQKVSKEIQIISNVIWEISKNNVKENRTRIPHEYQVGDQALMNDNQAYKYEPQKKGSYQILQKQ